MGTYYFGALLPGGFVTKKTDYGCFTIIPSTLQGEKVRMRGDASLFIKVCFINPHPGPLPVMGEGIV